MTSRKFWGWGYENPEESFDPQLFSIIEGRLKELFEVDEFEIIPPPTIEEVKKVAKEPRFELPSPFYSFCTKDVWERAYHSFGKSYRDLMRCLRRQFQNMPDYVAFPRVEENIISLFEFCSKEKIALVPYGGGSSVVGGVEPTQSTHYKGVITVDMKYFNRVLKVDQQSKSALIQAGIYGPELERKLKKNNLTLRHYPQSFEFSTLGGWIATRGGGHYATNLTHIDEFVESLRIVTPVGIIETNRLPASGAGPNPLRFFIGSEGIFGIVTEAWMRLSDRPKYRASCTVKFANFMDGVQAVRCISQSGIYPSNLRLVDATEALFMGLGDGENAVLLLGFESATVDNFDSLIQTALKFCEKYGGKWRTDATGTKSGESSERDTSAGKWRNSFLKAPYLRDMLAQRSIITETFETACTWDNFEQFHHLIIRSVNESIDKYCEGKGYVTCRFTHVYPDGPAPYYSVIAKGKQGFEIENWDKIKDAVSNVIVHNEGTITHHHSVGKDHQPYYEVQEGKKFLEILASVKKVLDPEWILNPGVLLKEPLGLSSKL